MQQWTTSAIKPSKQFEYWRETVCQSFVPLRPERSIGSARSRFRGELSAWQSAGIRFARVSGDGQSVYRDAKSITSQDQAVYFLNYQYRGHSVVEQAGRKATLSPGSFALLDAMQPFRMEVSDNFDQLSIKIPHTVLTPLFIHPPQALAYSVGSASAGGRLAMKAFVALADEVELELNTFTHIALKNALRLLALSLSSNRDGVASIKSSRTLKTLDALRQRAMLLMQTELSNADFSPNQTAQDLGVSLRYLQAAFAQSNTSMREWILEQRLSRCRTDLLQALRMTTTIASIAYSHGFNDLSYFNRAFKSRYGCTPGSLLK
jgi:AraC family transcriptional regulator, positive regulator of tynA and feaB